MASVALRGATFVAPPSHGSVPLTLPQPPLQLSPPSTTTCHSQTLATVGVSSSLAFFLAAAQSRHLRQLPRRVLLRRATESAVDVPQETSVEGSASPSAASGSAADDAAASVDGAAAAVGSKSRFRIERRGVKGLGAVATEDMPKGSVVLFEPPLLMFETEALEMLFGFAEGGGDILVQDPFIMRDWEKGLSDAVDGAAYSGFQPENENDKEELSEEQEKIAAGTVDAFWALADTSEVTAGADMDKTAVGITRTNALSLGPDAAGLFLRVSRFNHSCSPNVYHHWVEEDGGEDLRTTRDVKEGEELCISYLSQDGLFSSARERQGELVHQFGFRCECEVCSAGKRAASFVTEQDLGDMAAISDRRRQRLRELNEALRRPRQSTAAPSDGPKRGGGRKLAQEADELLDAEFGGHPAASALVHFAAFRRSLDADMLDVAREMAATAYENALLAEGADSMKVEKLKEYAENPEQFRIDMAEPDDDDEDASSEPNKPSQEPKE